MNASVAIFTYDSDAYFREELRNFLLAAGYSDVELAATVRDALAKLRERCYHYVLIPHRSRASGDGRR